MMQFYSCFPYTVVYKVLRGHFWDMLLSVFEGVPDPVPPAAPGRSCLSFQERRIRGLCPLKPPDAIILFYLGFERGLPLSRISRREMRLRRAPAGATGPGVLSKTGNHTRLPKSASKARKAPVRAQGSHKTPTECVLWDRGDTAQRAMPFGVSRK